MMMFLAVTVDRNGASRLLYVRQYRDVRPLADSHDQHVIRFQFSQEAQFRSPGQGEINVGKMIPIFSQRCINGY